MPVHRAPPIIYPGHRQIRKFTTGGIKQDVFNARTSNDMVRHFEDFISGTTTTIPISFAAGGAGTAATYVTSSLGIGGVVGLATGGVDNQCSTLYYKIAITTADQNPTLHVYMDNSSMASGNMQIGFTDANITGVLDGTGVGPIVSPLAAVTPTLTGSAADCAVAIYDQAGPTNPTYWRLAGARTSTTFLTTPTTTDASRKVHTAGTPQWISVGLRRSERGATDQCDVILAVDGIEIAHKRDGGPANTVQLVPFVLIGATSGTGRTAYVDAWDFYADRNINI